MIGHIQQQPTSKQAKDITTNLFHSCVYCAFYHQNVCTFLIRLVEAKISNTVQMLAVISNVNCTKWHCVWTASFLHPPYAGLPNEMSVTGMAVPKSKRASCTCGSIQAVVLSPPSTDTHTCIIKMLVLNSKEQHPPVGYCSTAKKHTNNYKNIFPKFRGM